jgi:hypothetical protein
VATAQVTQALQNVYQARAALGLPAAPPAGTNLADVPPDLDQTFSSVRQALADLLHSAAQLGLSPTSYNLTPKQIIEEFYRRDPQGDIDKIYAQVTHDAPTLKQAQANLDQAQRDLDLAKLDLSYCKVAAEIDGVVTRRNVNPGNNVEVGQTLMAIRSLREIWVDANFKETQLRDLRIGQRAELKVDMYGGRQKFEGRISGFTMGTGSTLALLPMSSGSWPLLLLLLLVWGTAGFGMMVPQQSRLAALAPAQAPMLLSLNASMLYLGTAGGAVVGGALVSSLGFAQLSWAGVPFVAAALVVLWLAPTFLPSTTAKERAA